MKTTYRLKGNRLLMVGVWVFLFWPHVAAADTLILKAGWEYESGATWIFADAFAEAVFGSPANIHADFRPLTDQALNQVRGGFGGFHFGISLSGVFDKLGNLSGQIFSGNNSLPPELIEDAVTIPSFRDPKPNSPIVPAPVTEIATAEVDGARISAYVGNFDGASGIFQISQSPGSYNVITNNMNINITIYNFSGDARTSAFIPPFFNALQQ